MENCFRHIHISVVYALWHRGESQTQKLLENNQYFCNLGNLVQKLHILKHKYVYIHFWQPYVHIVA